MSRRLGMMLFTRVAEVRLFEMVGAGLIVVGIAAVIGLLVGAICDARVSGRVRANLRLIYWAGLVAGTATILSTMVTEPFYDGEMIIGIFRTGGAALVATGLGSVLALLAGAVFDRKLSEAAQRTLWGVFWSTLMVGALLILSSIAFA